MAGDSLGDRMKEYENRETSRHSMMYLPLYIRLDGRAFHSFTKGFDRPFDERMTDAMIELAIALAKESGAVMAYQQSDEVSLILYSDSYESQIYFNGRIFKITSVLAAFATGSFMKIIERKMPGITLGKMPMFDCRVCELPNLVEAANMILWRELDATKNAISMAAQSVCSHNDLQGKNGSEMQEMLFQKGINFNDYPAKFKRGTFILKRPDAEYPERMRYTPVDMPKFRSIINRTGVLFNREEPVVEES